jgi:hypothetical protein
MIPAEPNGVNVLLEDIFRDKARWHNKCLTQYRTDRIWGWKIKFGHLGRKREAAIMKSQMLLNMQVPDMEKRIIVAQPYNC